MAAASSHARLIHKKRVVFILGATATGKSKLAVSLAVHFAGEVINSDKMQVYRGLDVITNKITGEECAGVRHHLLGFVHPDAEYSAGDFRNDAVRAVDDVLARGRLPIIAGGSNSYVRELVAGRYDCCFIWIDVDPPELDGVVGERVEKMVERGMVEEARGVFDAAMADYSKGIWRAIGLPELDRYLRWAAAAGGEENGEKLLAEAMEEIRENTRKLARVQREKIVRLMKEDGWPLFRVDATPAVRRLGEAARERVWEETVVKPSVRMVECFVGEDGEASVVCRQSPCIGIL
ncbi:Adenylate isopentenyltransferase 5, chloroplastic [Apostasia shenzhenica]|uniref:adenylate dimethylallyltransferase (ADP/ATP-dependent) n=1 Tax=Apostasia shenzhenica TaxID=1088818 RepID=A0A2I0BAN5_9ASPA|nr:Adenylate isopentenyltransferase 5, chloroplastic [Apostasia shenzhenica]